MEDYKGRNLAGIALAMRSLARIVVRPGGGVSGDKDLNPDDWVDPKDRPDLRLASGLVPIIEHDAGTTLLLTRRADHLNSHSGQVAFPGGKV